MFRSKSLVAIGGDIPRNYGFRLRPRTIPGVAVSSSPFPVVVRDQSTHENDLLVYDSSFHSRRPLNPVPGKESMCGPFVIDPDGLRVGWAWDAEWVDEPGESIAPGSDARQDGLALLFDATGAAAAIDSGILDTSWVDYLLIYATNGDAAARILSRTVYDATGAVTLLPSSQIVSVPATTTDEAIWGLGTVAAGNVPGPVPPKVRLVLAAGTTSGRLTVYGHRLIGS